MTQTFFAHFRCRDLLEVCEGQIQFARKSKETQGQPGPLPQFGGTRGQEITKALLGIQASFANQIARLRNLDYEILDVKTSRWHASGIWPFLRNFRLSRFRMRISAWLEFFPKRILSSQWIDN